MWVKICANTNLDDSLEAIRLGADAVGFVFAPSKRQVTAEQVAAITPHLAAHVERVGVFLAGDVEATARAAEVAGLTAIQMHGGIDPGYTARLRDRLGPEISLIHVAHWQVGADGGAADGGATDGGAAEQFRGQLDRLAALGSAERVLVDARLGKASGGLGVSFDWAQAAAVLADYPRLRVIVAGGLTPGSVAEAIRAMAPFGVDVASGVEAVPGRKDAARLRLFIENARSAQADRAF